MVHMIATKSGMEGKGCAQVLLDNFIACEANEPYVFIANRPNPDYLQIDDTDWQQYEDDTEELTDYEKMYFHIDDDRKQDIFYSSEQVEEILKGTKPVENNTTIDVADLAVTASPYDIDTEEENISRLMNLYEMNHCCPSAPSISCDDDNLFQFGYNSHMYQRKISPTEKTKLRDEFRKTDNFGGYIKEDEIEESIVKSTIHVTKVRWFWHSPVELPDELSNEQALTYNDRGYFFQTNALWGNYFQEMSEATTVCGYVWQ